MNSYSVPVSKIPKVDSSIRLIIYGLFLHSFFGILFSVYEIPALRAPQILGVVLLLIATKRLFAFYNVKMKYNIIFTLFIVCQLLIVFRIQLINMDNLRLMLFDQLNLFSYFIPLCFFLPVKLGHFKFFCKALTLFSLIFFLFHLFVIFSFPINNFTDNIVISSLPPVGLLLLLVSFIEKKYAIISLIIVSLIMIIGLVYGRRTVVLTSGLYIVFSFCLNVLFNKRRSFTLKFFSVSLIGVAIFFLVNFFTSSDDSSIFQIKDRIDTDSRTEVVNAFVNDFGEFDYLVGRGINGAFYNPTKYWNLENDDYREVVWRTNIENGYLYFILKGGIIYLALFLIMIFRAIYLAFFRANNLFVKGTALYLVVYLTEMIGFGQPAVIIKYFLVWVCIGICSSAKFRKLSNQQVHHFINFPSGKTKRI
jgi:hypothetical protein